jgi:hypothetical protein
MGKEKQKWIAYLDLKVRVSVLTCE